jgi:NADH:ubiquinone reductase (H+-translocating)
MADLHHVLILGGGFGGLYAAKSLRRAPLRITLIDRRNFHLFQPLLYQVATGGLSPANIAAPLRSILRKQKNVRVLLAEACDFDLPRRRVVLSDGEVEYDALIVATGSHHHYFGHDRWQQLAPGLKTIEDATEIRRRVLLAFEAAERETRPESVREWLNFVIVGGGPTGVELAGALAEIARNTLKDQFTSINPADAKILLVEGGPRVLPTYPPRLSEKAKAFLEQLGVAVRTGAMVTDVQPDSVTIRADGGEETVSTRTVLWGAGVKASPLGLKLAQAAGIQPDRIGRINVGPDLTVPGHPEVFVIGDLANFSHQTGEPLPGIAPVAMQEATYAAKLIAARQRGQTLPPFHYRDKGTLATVGRNRAVAVIGKLKLAGYFAWLIWLFVHLMYIVEFANRILVLVQWAWNYLTWNRPARLITGENPLPISREPGVRQAVKDVPCEST